MMEPQQISESWTVSDALQKYPEASRAFIERRTFCLGCHMARFCTLRVVANVYDLEVETLIREIQQAAINITNQNSKE